MKVNGLILAAGNSSRLGQPKQLIQYNGKSLLAGIESKLIKSCDQVFVVLGFKAGRFSQEITQSKIINNSNWQAGMGESLAIGVKTAGVACDGLLIALCDQPWIELEHYQKLIEAFKQNHKHNSEHIIATSYSQQNGVPALFPKSQFHSLSELHGDSGAQSVIKSSQHVINIECLAASYDIDSVEDLSKLDSSSVG